MFLYKSTEQIKDNIKGYIDSFLDYIDDPISTLFLFIFIVLFYFAIYITGIPMSSGNKAISISIFENAILLTIVIGVFENFFKYILGFSMVDAIRNSSYFKKEENPVPASTPAPAPAPAPEKEEEVFNIKNNLYTYEDAQAVCKSYGARLATYDEIEEAYNDGAEWCNYGWSENQMAFYPTQKATWEKLQSNPKRKNNCGRPGVNGGYMSNPYIRFGVNCYGKKPKASEADLSAMNNSIPGVSPVSDEDKLLEDKINYFKKHSNKFMKINSFNTNQWSENNGR